MDLSIHHLIRLSGWVYLIIVVVAAGDAILPVLPSESVVILGGFLASRGHLSLVLVLATAAVGAFIGDNISYQIGRAANRKGKNPENLSGRFGDALGWAEAALKTRGSTMIVVSRFIPGGRTAITFGSGYLGYSRLRFAGSTALAGLLWGTYAALLGYFGGQVFKEKWWAALLFGFGISLVVAGVIELVRRLTGHGESISDKRDELQAERQGSAS